MLADWRTERRLRHLPTIPIHSTSTATRSVITSDIARLYISGDLEIARDKTGLTTTLPLQNKAVTLSSMPCRMTQAYP
jgi:hypothetical protein